MPKDRGGERVGLHDSRTTEPIVPLTTTESGDAPLRANGGAGTLDNGPHHDC